MQDDNGDYYFILFVVDTFFFLISNITEFIFIFDRICYSKESQHDFVTQKIPRNDWNCPFKTVCYLFIRFFFFKLLNSSLELILIYLEWKESLDKRQSEMEMKKMLFIY